MSNNTNIICAFEMPCEFTWEIVLEKAGFREENSFNRAVWSKWGVCDISVHDMSFCVHPFEDDVINKISPEIEDAICLLFNCKCSLEIGEMVTVRMWK